MIFNVVGGGGGGLSMERLWANARPSSSFSSQTISVNLAGFDLCCIEFDGNVADSHILMTFVPVGRKTWLQSEWNARMVRTATVNTTNIVFSQGQLGQYTAGVSSNDGACVPINIYGIKGVK